MQEDLLSGETELHGLEHFRYRYPSGTTEFPL
jgi:hypothetical protein